MSRIIKYTGSGNRELSSADLSQLGVDDRADLIFDDQDRIAEVDDETADALLSLGDFTELVEAPEAEETGEEGEPEPQEEGGTPIETQAENPSPGTSSTGRRTRPSA